MKELSENWLTDGLIDFEYKKYMLLAYLQSVEKNFTSNKLYPYLGELVQHYQNLVNFKFTRDKLNSTFPKQLSQIDLQNFVLRYEQLIQNDGLMDELEKILNFSLPVMRKYLEEGKEIYEWIEEQIRLRTVGIVPLEVQAGYLFVRNGGEKETKVYEYKLSFFQSASKNYRSIMTQYVNSYTTTITSTYEAIKEKVIAQRRLLIAPAVYVVESEQYIPFGESLLPIAKRVLVRHLMENELRTK